MCRSEVNVLQPPAIRFTEPIIDAHCHASEIPPTALMMEAGRLFNVELWIAICRFERIESLRRAFGEAIIFNVWIDYTHASEPRRFAADNIAMLKKAARQGARCVKFWYKPEFNHKTGFYFDDPRLDDVFRAMIDLDLAALVHIADPDIWYLKRYNDPNKYEPKWAAYRQLTNTLGRFPRLRVIVAHMGGNPENLAHLEGLLQQYPNCYLDTSATKWVVRELSKKPADARSFFIKWQDRLIFGTDLVARDMHDLEHYASRYWVHRFMYENSGTVPSPIPDGDADGPVFVPGLDLPDEVLRKLYRDNAIRFFKL